MTVWLDGRLVAADEARLDPRDRGFLLGDGLFETIAVRHGRALRVDRHMDRLAGGMAAIGLPSADAGDIPRAMERVRQANGLREGCIRVTVSRGPARRGLLPDDAGRPTLLVAATACGIGFGAPLRAVVAASTRRNEFSPLARIKSVAYLDGILARREAAARGADEAIVRNTRGDIAETTVANLFLVVDGRVRTPAVETGALPGVMRAEVISRLDAEEARVTREDLEAAAEVFATNALGIRPIIEIDGRPVGDGRPGPVTSSLADLP